MAFLPQTLPFLSTPTPLRLGTAWEGMRWNMVEQAVLGSLATATPVTLLALSLSSWRSYEENMSI